MLKNEEVINAWQDKSLPFSSFFYLFLCVASFGLGWGFLIGFIFSLTACSFGFLSLVFLFFFLSNSPSISNVVNWIKEVGMRAYDYE